jgi:fucose permease
MPGRVKKFVSKITFLSYASYLTMILTGLVSTTFGAALPEIRDTLEISISQTGTLIVAKTIGFIIATFFSGVVIAKFGKKALGCLGAATSCCGLLAFGILPGLWINFAVYLVVGIGAGCTQVVANSLIIDLYDKKRSNMMNLLHFFFTFGSVLGPLYAGLVFRHALSWRFAFMTCAVIALIIFCAFILLPFPDKTRDCKNNTDIRSFNLLKERLVLLLLVLLGFHVTVQLGVGNWLTSYLEEYLSLPHVLSSNILTFYWVGMAIGRFVCYKFSHRLKHHQLMLAMVVGSFVFLLVSIIASSSAQLLVLLALLGFSLSGFYPMVVVIGGSLYQRRSGAVIGVLAAGASISSTLLQWFMAQLSEVTDIRTGMVFYISIAFLTIPITIIVFNQARKAGYVDM